MAKISGSIPRLLFGFALINVIGIAGAQPKTDTDCQCRDSTGSMQNLGTVVCVNITGTDYLVRCEMSQNTPYWNRVNDESGCPMANNGTDLKKRLSL